MGDLVTYFRLFESITKSSRYNIPTQKLHTSAYRRLFTVLILKYERHLSHHFSSCHTLGAQRFNVFTRLQFGAYLCRLTVIEVLKVIVESVD
ncbi:hypothetical protein [Enterobacter cloacae]|uniref:hypothetical protein n=1 Tax=Enterobacter cloacae TaxID=550 RepID=UPI0013B04B9F|nr:hypothetical protein [Enterobacter cloacae]